MDENIFKSKSCEKVTCSICQQQCTTPIEREGYSNLSAARADVRSKWWESNCSFWDEPLHNDAIILWKRLKSENIYTSEEIQAFQIKLDELREKINRIN